MFAARASTRDPVGTLESEVVLDVPKAALRRWNLAMAAFHTALAAAVLGLGDLQLHVPVYNTPIAIATLANASVADAGWMQVPQTPTRVADLYYTQVASIFFLVSAVAHWGAALVWQRKYVHHLARARNPYRWVEYAVGAPVMLVLTAYLCGVLDAATLVSIAALTTTTMAFGHLHEELNRPASARSWSLGLSTRLQAHLLGYAPQLVAWGITLARFFDNAGRSTKIDGQTLRMPDFVYAIVVGEFFVFFSFAVVQFAVTMRPPREYYKGEIAYMVLSLISKGFLGIMLLSNVLMLERSSSVHAEDAVLATGR